MIESVHRNDLYITNRQKQHLKHMTTKTRTLSKEALEQILTEARTHSVWLPEPLSDDLLVPSVSTAVRCQALTMPKWMRPFLKAQTGNQISSAISVMEIRANFAPEHRALNLMRHAKSSDFNDWRSG